jgi:hypothetical protein
VGSPKTHIKCTWFSYKGAANENAFEFCLHNFVFIVGPKMNRGAGWVYSTLGKARQGKARQGKARQGKARQGKARQGKARQGKARQGKARQGKAPATGLPTRNHLPLTTIPSHTHKLQGTPRTRTSGTPCVGVGGWVRVARSLTLYQCQEYEPKHQRGNLNSQVLFIFPKFN